MLEVQNLTKTYRGPEGLVKAVDDISLQVNAGEFLAVRGPSGSGKTTLLLAVGGLEVPDKGHVIVDEKDTYSMTPDARARFRAATIGFVFQQFYLVPYLSVMDNVLAPSVALSNPEAGKRAQELVERFNLTDRSGHKPSELSTGERQRTAMARALLNNPKLCLADEPTGNLDMENAENVLNYLKEFSKSGGAVLMVTHSDQVASYSHGTIHIRNGKIQ